MIECAKKASPAYSNHALPRKQPALGNIQFDFFSTLVCEKCRDDGEGTRSDSFASDSPFLPLEGMNRGAKILGKKKRNKEIENGDEEYALERELSKKKKKS